MRNASARTVVLVTMLVTLMIGGIFLVNDAFTKRQIVVSTPTPDGVFAHPTVTLKPGQRLCMTPVVFPTDADLAQVLISPPKRPTETAELLITVTADGKRQDTRVRRQPSGLTFAAGAVPDNPKTAQGDVCVRNVGRVPADLLATNEARFQTLTMTVGPGKPQPASDPARVSVSLSLIDSRPQTLISRFDDAVKRANQFSGGLSQVLLWLLVATVVLGVPAATIAAMMGSFSPRD